MTPRQAQGATVIVAVDGPAGSGKSSVSRAAARALGFGYLDTGAAYRALSWSVLDRGIDPEDADAVVAGLPGFDYAIGTDPDDYFVRVGRSAGGAADVTGAIREPRVTAVVSAIARVPAVRAHLVDLFRSIAAATDRPGVVIEGRDITTVVAPDAPVRILLTASEAVRMARRSAEVTTQSARDTAAALAKRDAADAKVVDFMNAAEGVTTLDSTDLTFDETVAAVVDLVRAASSAG
ncbi:(d)CMP kinase [Galbitalea sp. SE-J8]|uniref:(d)CMP kinase n=1 Tax=Galbitalea sp. SE-J8 TaxID=3054952 RepID=UPI00259CBECF|nr:(d)CMP kinase [Galbitalea sp. SE-J8]MDM4764300.1 (d)CMP kinase [Galbitalea sp. SE-J8]